MFEEVKKFYDHVFGNNDGKFNFKDLPNSAVGIVVLVADIVMLIAEWRVYSVGKYLTGSTMLALGFVAVSSVPFYLGQLAYRYNRANEIQQAVSIGLVLMGLGVSAYYGFADYIIATKSELTLADGVTLAIDVNSLFYIAVICTVILIVSGLTFGLVDDDFANTLKQKRIEGRAATARKEIDIKKQLLVELRELREEESRLRSQYPEDFDALQAQFLRAANKQKNPTNGNGKS